LPARGWMSFEALSARRKDLIMMRLVGNFDGTAAVDYTINCSSGLPIATGANADPVNHVLPAWDVAAGLYLTTGLLAAERVRRREGRGQEVVLALSDVMLATIGNLGYIGDVQINGVSREPIGNYLYGAFGRNFTTADRREVMIVAISRRQWKELGKATGLTEKFEMIGPLMDVDLATEGGRYAARATIAAVLEPWVAARSLAEIERIFAKTGVLWGAYRDFRQLVEEDYRCTLANPMFAEIDQANIGRVLTPRSPLSFSCDQVLPPQPAPRLGQDTVAVLEDIVGLSRKDVDEFRRRGIFDDRQ
jgi:2-methylfumaryl-CoA isomerase